VLLNRSRAFQVIDSQGFDALVATSPDNVLYASDYECATHWINKGAQIYALLTPGHSPQATLIAPLLEAEAVVGGDVWIEDVYLVGMFQRNYQYEEMLDEVGRQTRALIERAPKADSTVDGLVQALTARGLERGRIGIDETGVSPAIWAELARRLPNATIEPANTVWWQIRMVKTPEEIRRLRTAAEATEQAIEEGLARARPGVSEAEVVQGFHEGLAKRGAKPAFSCFGSGPRSAYPHISESDRVMQAGDVLRYDVGCIYRYYYSDTARTRVLGEPDDRQKRMWEAMVRGVDDAIALVRPGADPAAIWEAAMSPAWKAGFTDFARVHCGHGIGITVYDPPLMSNVDPRATIFLMPGAPEGLQENMVINIEAGYYVQGIGGFQCEETMVVTAAGCNLFTHNSRDLAMRL
jgi:Xaa-Pro aminopeptidase